MTNSNDENASVGIDQDAELLTSYLDGELSDAETTAVEQRIASDTQFRLQMQKLQKTWDLLETLPPESANASFTKTTMELVVDDAVSEIRSRTGANWKRPLKIVAMIVAPVLLCAGSFLAARQIQHKNRQQLVEVDLPVIERFDHYLAIDQNLGFMEDLHDSGLFSDETALYSADRDELAPELWTGTTVSVSAGAAPPAPFARLEAMDADQRNSLRRKREKFERMPPQQQNELRQFHQQFSSHEKSKQLRETLSDYFDWLGTLSSRERAELADKPVEDRLSDIARTLIRRASQEFGRSGITQLPPEDAQAVFEWHEAVLKRNAKKIRSMYKDLVRKRYRKKGLKILDKPLSKLAQHPLNQLIGVLIPIDREPVKQILYSEFDQLLPKLSEDAREILDSKTTNGQQELLLNWTEAANQTRSKVTIVQLQKFYEQLSSDQRDALDEMSFENWEQTLTRLYRQKQLSRSTDTDDLSDERSVQSLAEESGLEVPDQPEDEIGITIQDMGIPLNLETGLNLDGLNLEDLFGTGQQSVAPDESVDEAIDGNDDGTTKRSTDGVK